MEGAYLELDNDKIKRDIKSLEMEMDKDSIKIIRNTVKLLMLDPKRSRKFDYRNSVREIDNTGYNITEKNQIYLALQNGF